MYEQVFESSATTGSGWLYINQNDDYVFYASRTNITGRELWRSDGTTAGTMLVKDINPSDESYIRWQSSLASSVVDNTLYFMASDGTHGRELWKSDGTEAGTVMVKDVWPGASWGLESEYMVEFKGGVAFEARDDNGTELWISDGTEAGTIMVKDIRTGSDGSFVRYLEVMNDELFFFATEGGVFSFWKTDGTEAGTEKLVDLAADSDPEHITALDGNVIFYNFTTSDPTKDELWISDGTVDGTNKITDTNSRGPINEKMTRAGDNLFFRADDNDASIELYKTDGTSGGSGLVKDLSAGDGFPENFIEYQGEIYFVSNSDIWKSDGTGDGTVMVVEGVENRTEILSDGNNLYYRINNNLGIYNLDNGPQEIETSPDFYVIELLTVFKGELYFTGEDDLDDLYPNLWKYNPSGSAATLSIDSQPVNENACEGGDASFSISASGSTNLTYQWQEDQGSGFVDMSNGSGITGVTTTTLQLSSLVETMDAFQYRCVISGDNAADVVSDVANLSISMGPEITSQPNDQTVDEGLNITFSVTAIGDNLSYQWEKEGIDISGATTNTLSLSSVSLADAGAYQCSIGNDCGVEDSSIANLNVSDSSNPLNVGGNVDRLLIYPSPAAGHFTLKLPNETSESTFVRMSDLAGKQVFVQAVKSNSDELLVETSAFEPGTYIVSVFTGSTVMSSTLVIK